MQDMGSDGQPAATPSRLPSDRVPTDHGHLLELIAAFTKLGCISFGGPVAHLGYLRSEFVDRRRWLGDDAYADLVALCQFLPGPASSQVVFALGMLRAGLTGAVLASACFMFPSVAIMIAFAYGVSAVADLSDTGWLHGLKLTAVAVVAQAVWAMGKSLCPDRTRVTLCVGTAAVVLVWPSAITQLGVILLGGIIGWYLFRSDTPAPAPVSAAALGDCALESTVAAPPRHRQWAIVALVAYAVLLVALPPIASALSQPSLTVFDSFYRAGALVFGGGHVVLPLLRAEVVPTGWVSDDVFLAGYGAAQALPGPLFTFAAYLGCAMQQPGGYAWANGLWCLLAIFLPGWLLVGGSLGFWHGLRRRRWAQAALRGANSAVVGLLLSALYQPVITEGIRHPHDVAAALVAFVALQLWKVPPWAVVLLMAVVGQWLLP